MTEAIKKTLARLRNDAERMYAFSDESPYVQREAKGMVKVINEVENAMQEGDFSELQSDFGTRLKHVRVEMHMTQAEAAEFLGHSRDSQQNYESNRKDPGTKRAKQIAEAFGVPFLWLIGYGDTFSCENTHVREE